MFLRKLLNTIIYYPYKKDKDLHFVRCLIPQYMQSYGEYIDINCNDIISVLHSGFKFKYPLTNEEFVMDYNNVIAIINKFSGKSFVFRQLYSNNNINKIPKCA